MVNKIASFNSMLHVVYEEFWVNFDELGVDF
jgi:hypothetical protein